MSNPIVRDFDDDLELVPRHWLAGNPAATAISNGINMLFPHGERFFVRSVHHFADQVKNPELKKQIKAFFGQEGRHARAHDQFNEVLRLQGFKIDEFLDRYAKISRWVEQRVPAKLNLAGTAASEHFTAILADGAFSKGVLDELDPRMQKLLAWHAAEEIEHKAVAYDVLQEIDSSYLLRVAGLAYSTIMLGGFWAWATVMLARQEHLNLRRFLGHLAKMRGREPVLRRVFLSGIRQYIKRDFHPRHNANEHLAEQWFAARGLAMPAAA
jgi:predicted metal-dependent hydrolase